MDTYIAERYTKTYFSILHIIKIKNKVLIDSVYINGLEFLIHKKKKKKKRTENYTKFIM